MRQGLFRQEAVEHNRPTLVGEVLAAHRLPFRFVTIASLLLTCTVITYLFFGTYTPKARVRGYLAPSAGLIKVYALQPGTLTESYVTEGQQVARGDVLFVLSSERGSLQVAQPQGLAIQQIEQRRAQVELEQHTQQQIDRVQEAELRERLAGMRAQRQQMLSTISLQQQRVTQVDAIATRFANLVEQKFVSVTQAAEQQSAALEQQTRLQELRLAQSTLERDINSLRQQIASASLEAAQRRSQMQRDQVTLEQERTEYEARRTVVIVAPADGMVTAILTERGQSAGTQTALLTILPKHSVLQARLLVPSRAIGAVARGGSVSLRYDAFPYQRFGSFAGRITEVSRTLLAPAEIDAPVRVAESSYRVTVALDAQLVNLASGATPLQAGMELEADILLERRRLILWLFEPLLTLARKI